MVKIRVIFLYAILAIFGLTTKAQNNILSPYAMFGDSTIILDAKNKNFTIDYNIYLCYEPNIVNDSIYIFDQNKNIIFRQKLNSTDIAIFTTGDPKTEEMTWVSPYAYGLRNPLRIIDIDGERPDEYEAALMAQAVYNKNLTNDNLPKDLKGWTLSSFNTSITKNLTDWNQNGLQSALFERTIDGVTEYAYVYAGSNSIEDVLEDIAQIAGLAPQYSSAIDNAKTLSSELENKELTFVGHSLGGGEAAAASMATGRAAITFNPASVSYLTSKFHNLGNADNVTNYRLVAPGNGSIRFGGCFISNLQNNLFMKPPGKTINIPAPNNNPITAHGIKNFVNYFRKKH
ncbi:hypothetical protein [Bacteroides caecimuris]|jgi:hypothetical protein|uniref:hypothetical protein n=1 Tax=Bacteroides caecimuris TaxID=1796613 RepID=UPI002649BDAF|nr:hypothetical protein [Bacteroides caecimuris]